MSKSRKSSNVPGQFLGYSLQATECLRQLLCASSGDKVSVEAFEDVGVQKETGALDFVQTKSAISANNPVSNKSIEWWKALGSWVRWAEQNNDSLQNARFFLHVFSAKPITLVAMLSNAQTSEQAEAALNSLQETMWGVAPLFSLRDELNPTLKDLTEQVFNAERSTVTLVIQRFSLSFGSGDVKSDIVQLLLEKFTPDEYVDEVHDQMLGWVKSQIDAALQVDQPAIIEFSAFRKAVNSFLAKLRFEQILYDFAGEFGEIDIEEHRLKKYVRQLQAIAAEEEDVLEAINSYLRAAINRSVWSEKYLVDEDSMAAFEKSLCRIWNNTRQQHNIQFPKEPDEQRGKRLFLACMVIRKALDGREVPDDFTPGSFHTLADTEDVGWHPNYKTKLKEVAQWGA